MALREINLVPSNILARRQLLRHFSFWAACLVILLAPIFGFYVYRAGATLAQKRSFTNSIDINKQLSQKVNTVKRIQEELKKLNQKQTALQAVIGHSNYSKIIFKLADTVNRQTWLESLRIDSDNRPKNPTALQVNGYAGTNEALGNFLNRLTGDPMFENVILKYAKETQMKKSDAIDKNPPKRVQFEIVFNILRG
jgi:Tfp pilus assembly protein PilN